jgi:hypothetical protein
VAVAFVATVPAVVLVALTMIQFALAGHAAMAAAGAARAAARASYAGTDVEAAAEAALPESLRPGMAVSSGRGGAKVRVQAPRALPLLPRIPVEASAELGPEGGIDDG